MQHSPQEVRDRILAHASGKFMASGFRRVTMEDIARELGLSKKTLYTHFPGKQDLLVAAIRAQLEGLKIRLDEAFETRGLPFTARFHRLLQAVGPQLAAVQRPLVDDLYRHAPRGWKEIEEFRRVYVFDRLEQLIGQGVEEGLVRDDLDPRLVVFIITHAIQSALSPEKLTGLGVSLSDVFAAAMSLLYCGIFTERGRREVRGTAAGRKVIKDE